MKQHITTEQLNELSEKGKEKLREWFEKSEHYPEFGDDVVNVYIPEINQPHKGLADQRMIDDDGNELSKAYHYDMIPLLSIGQMIEFLDDRFYSINTIEKDGKRIGFFVTYRDEPIIQSLRGDRPELCDALWEACKEILNDA